MRAFIGLGGNLGDRALSLMRARRLVTLASTDAAHARASSIFESEPIGELSQPPFLNAVLSIETTLAPIAILDWLLRVEQTLGRVRDGVRGPRVIDLDLLAVDGTVLNSARLRLPHPEISNRRFVLEPFCEVAPDWIHPVLGKPVVELLDALPAAPWVRRLGDIWWEC
ncbi:MAG: 2-amino-4-hydroxy-6-hydroxymethyldihydropteridine diphosphokinase [Deltaproteobacteria bacterium]|nr:2-amino-4-hydroxy-6-hydroxymethyldihydropteridine diphosphokinase [Deltaproteobacteria bacterium]